MYFSEIYSIFFLDGFFHILYLFEKSEIFMPHPVYTTLSVALFLKALFLCLIIIITHGEGPISINHPIYCTVEGNCNTFVM